MTSAVAIIPPVGRSIARQDRSAVPTRYSDDVGRPEIELRTRRDPRASDNAARLRHRSDAQTSAEARFVTQLIAARDTEASDRLHMQRLAAASAAAYKSMEALPHTLETGRYLTRVI
ncbi:MAG: hypothetical protein AAGF59_13835 [Pseudomonadota bacterium]